MAATTWNAGRDREVIDRFVIHRELEAFRNEIFWKGLAISAVCEWNGASPDPRRAPKGLAAESSRNPSLSLLVPTTPFGWSCLWRQVRIVLSSRISAILAHRSSWHVYIDKKCVQRFYIPLRISHSNASLSNESFYSERIFSVWHILLLKKKKLFSLKYYSRLVIHSSLRWIYR